MFEDILSNYDFITDIKSISPYGNGRINRTYLIDANEKFVLQKINSDIFKNVEGLMKNVELVTDHIREKINNENSDRKTLNLIKTNDGSSFVQANDGYYRISEFIENGTSIDKTNDLNLLKEAGRAYGQFQYDLRDFDANKLSITIPNFHNTLSRFYNLGDAIEKCTDLERMEKADNLIQKAMDNSKYANAIVLHMNNGNLPKRVVHNDTKLNNVVFNKDSGRVMAVLDLDTVMPGSILFDIGDGIRSACSNALEDETDKNKIYFNLDLIKEYLRGFLEETYDFLTQDEINYMGLSIKIITYEQTIRFLTDYINGDTYFKIKYKEHNKDRFLNQYILLQDIEIKLDEINEFIFKTIKELKKN